MGKKAYSVKDNVAHVVNWFIFNFVFSLLPLAFAMGFKWIVGYKPTLRDFAPDYLLVLFSVLLNSYWSIDQNDKLFTKEIQSLVRTVHVLLIVTAIASYFALFGEFTIPNVINPDGRGAYIIVSVATAMLFADATWGCVQEFRSYKKSNFKKKKPNS